MARKKLDLDQMARFRKLLDLKTDEMMRVRKKIEKAVDDSNNYWKDDRRAGIVARLSQFTFEMTRFEYKAKEFSEWLRAREIKGTRFLEGG